MLELLDREFKIIMIKVLRTLMGKIDNKKGHREMELYKKNKKKMLDIKKQCNRNEKCFQQASQ